MSFRLPVVTRNRLASAASLLTCSLASAASLQHSTLQSGSMTATLGGTSGNASISTATTYAWNAISISAGYGYGYFGCWNGTYSGINYDIFGSNISVYAPSGSASFTQTFVINLSTAMRWGDGTFSAGWSFSWTIDGNAAVDGSLISAGQHTLVGNATYAGALTYSLYFSSGFYLPAGGGGGGGVPLPGAAGLAACGLFGLARRRRR